jgi:macrolide-specific efflux system membrane fusion protein
VTKRSFAIAGLAIAAAAFVAFVYYYWWSAGSAQAAAEVVAVERGDIEITVTATGVVRPRNRLEIKPPLAGRIEEVLVDEGDRVRKGQILAWMSSTERAALLDAARARGQEELARWSEFYKPTPILAPIAGTVIKRNVEPGQSFTAQDAVLVVADRLIVEAQVDETDIAQVRLAQPARIVLDAYPQSAIEGRVGAIAYEARTVNNVTTYPVEVQPRVVPAFMKSGMTASVQFFVDVKRDTLLLPLKAVRRGRGKPYVLLAATDPPGQPAERVVELGLSDGRRVEILSGLAEGEKVLVPAIETARRSATNPFSVWGRPKRERSPAASP